MKSKIAHKIKHRKVPNDEFSTPVNLVKKLMKMVPFEKYDTVLDAAYGTGNFYNNFPYGILGSYTKNFYYIRKGYEWIVTNPPYSCLDKWLEHTCRIALKGFGYLLGIDNLTPKRIEFCEQHGFFITKVFMCKVFKWYGMSVFVLWEKEKKPIIDYDRVVWR